jgi:hypothetical protein
MQASVGNSVYWKSLTKNPSQEWYYEKYGNKNICGGDIEQPVWEKTVFISKESQQGSKEVDENSAWIAIGRLSM